MLQRMKKMLKKEKGFTLVELLAVIAILGIITAIAVPTIGNVIGNSEDTAKEANEELFENAARLADVSSLEPRNSESGTDEFYYLSDLRDAGFLDEIPNEPGTENQYSAGVRVIEGSGTDSSGKTFQFDGSITDPNL